MRCLKSTCLRTPRALPGTRLGTIPTRASATLTVPTALTVSTRQTTLTTTPRPGKSKTLRRTTPPTIAKRRRQARRPSHPRHAPTAGSRNSSTPAASRILLTSCPKANRYAISGASAAKTPIPRKHRPLTVKANCTRRTSSAPAKSISPCAGLTAMTLRCAASSTLSRLRAAACTSTVSCKASPSRFAKASKIMRAS